ncbi:DNA primase family protein [Zafaria sp. Z1313]|uniref:DNA primase family protein n=1 Tax=Zafaria sp. Z1313 TaxID=3423202 RepID=UPI003D302E96
MTELARAFAAATDQPYFNAADGEKHRGQARMAYRLAAANASRLMFVRGIGWHVWDGTRWAVDERDTAKTAVLEVLRAALAESLDDRDLRTDVRRCESASGVNGVLELASSLPALRAATDDLDADPYLLNCANGTLDLRTRELREHDPADRITRVATGAYDPTAERRTWSEFLESVLPGTEERDYLQRVIGQSVYGAVREHLFPVLTGTGANGKGTAYGAITHAMGDYATIINPDLLMTSERGAGGPEQMALFGARLVIGSETEDGRHLDAALMKRLTGGDRLTARHLYQAPVSWEPSHQLVYVTNHLPQVKGNDPAVWRRIRIVPFDVVVPEDKRDPQLSERLKLAADAVLTWAVEGWFAYEDQGGMNEPDSVRRATDAYQTASDAVKRFTQDHCLTGPHFSARARDLFNAWTEWAIADGAEKLSEKAFGDELERLGFKRKVTKTGKYREGIGLPAEASENGGGDGW